MNLKTVLRTYGLLRQLTDDESALLATLRGMNDGERELLVESLQPEKVAAKKKLGEVLTRKIEKCDACNYTRRAVVHKDVNHVDGYHEFQPPKSSSAKGEKKSARAVEMAATLKGRREEQRRVTEDGPRCTYAMGDGVPCDDGEHSPTHDKSLGYLNYHEFVTKSAQAAGASD